MRLVSGSIMLVIGFVLVVAAFVPQVHAFIQQRTGEQSQIYRTFDRCAEETSPFWCRFENQDWWGRQPDKLYVAGSSSVFPLMAQLGEQYYQESRSNQPIAMEMASIGSTADLDAFCRGEEQVRNASQRLQPADFGSACPLESYRAMLTEQLVALVLASDAIVVTVRQDNLVTTLPNITMGQLYRILATQDRWSQIYREWTISDSPFNPISQIERVLPGEDSGTLEVLVEELAAALMADPDQIKQDILNAPNARTHENDTWAARLLLRDPHAISIFAYPFFKQRDDALVALPIQGTQPEDEDYPFRRDLYAYTTVTRLQIPAVREFLCFAAEQDKETAGELVYLEGPREIDEVQDDTRFMSVDVFLTEYCQ